ncbi:hypothetical protein [Propioniciclava sp.]|uniref:hypothetical protein n=1 Tax=Propioniciclava sp. TaxID=2038686 RepID=UPI00260617F6|nr:hypothetical protein [Propioniciclava sp.]
MRVKAQVPLDRLERDGRVVALYESHLVELGALGDAVVAAASDWIEESALADLLVAEFGAPTVGSASDVLETVLADLAAHGVILRG